MITIKFVKDCQYPKGTVLTLKNNEAHPFVFRGEAKSYRPRKESIKKPTKKSAKKYSNKMAKTYNNKGF